MWEAVGARGARADDARRAGRARARTHARAPGTCAGQFTANTMAVALDCLGLARARGTGSIPRRRARREGRGGRARRRAWPSRWPSRRRGPARFLDRRALRNAMAGIAARGGSTNGVLHLLAIAARRGSQLALDELRRASPRRTPVIANLAPVGALHGRGHAPRGRHARRSIRELIRAGRVDGDAPTVDGRDAGGGDGGRAATRTARCSSPLERAVQAERRAVRAAREHRARRQPGEARGHGAHARRRGPARVFDSEEACIDAVRAGHVAAGDVLVVRYEGPAGGPGMREMLSVTASVVGAGLGESRRARHRRPLLRRHARADGRARRARGGTRRAAGRRAGRGCDHDRRRRRARCAWTLDDARAGAPPRRLAAAARRATPAACSPATAPLVSSASEGAVLRPRL